MARAVYKLKAKIQIICEILHSLGKLPNAQPATLCAQCDDVNFNTLRGTFSRNMLSSRLEESISGFAGFDPYHSSWVDDAISESQRAQSPAEAQYLGLDTPAKFRIYLNGLLKLGEVERLKLQTYNPQTNELSPIVFSIDSPEQFNTQGNSLVVLIELDTVPKFHSGKFRYSLDACTINIKRMSDSNTEFEARLGQELPFNIKDAKLIGRGTKFEPRWILKSNGGSGLDGRYSSLDEPLCFMKNVEIGSKFEASISVHSLESNLISLNDDDMPSSVKAAIIKRMIEKSINSDVGETGILELARQTLEVSTNE